MKFLVLAWFIVAALLFHLLLIVRSRLHLLMRILVPISRFIPWSLNTILIIRIYAWWLPRTVSAAFFITWFIPLNFISYSWIVVNIRPLLILGFMKVRVWVRSRISECRSRCNRCFSPLLRLFATFVSLSFSFFDFLIFYHSHLLNVVCITP